MHKVLANSLVFIKKHRHKIILSTLIVLTVFRILLALNIPFIINFAPHDDGLVFDYAENIREGHWLGSYHELTLVKGTSFSAFLALCNFLMIPYNLGLILIYIFSIIVFCFAIKPKISKKYLYILYLLLLFSPFMFDWQIAQRLYRNNLLIPGTLLVFGSFIAIYLRRKYPIKKLIGWAALASLSLIFFWHLKEDSIWAMPFIGIISVLCLLYWCIKDRQKIAIKILLLASPFLVLFAFNSIYRFINQQVYGVAVINDRSEGNFTNMIKHLLTIDDPDNSDSRIWISQKMLEQAYDVSPTFALLKQPLADDKGWTDPSGEVRGDWIIWKIRAVMSKEGYYETATKASDFSAQVASELQEAFSNGSLKRDNRIHISALMRGLKPDDIPTMLTTQFDWFISLSNYQGVITANESGSANLVDTIEVQNFTKSTVAFPDNLYPNKAVSIASHITAFYRTFSTFVNILGAICFIFMLIYLVKQLLHKDFSNLDITLVVIGIGLSVVLVLSEVSIFVASFYDDSIVGNPVNIFYSAPILPLIQVFKYLPIAFVGEKAIAYFKNKNTTS